MKIIKLPRPVILISLLLVCSAGAGVRPQSERIKNTPRTVGPRGPAAKMSLPTCGVGKRRLTTSQLRRAEAFTRAEKNLYMKARATVRPTTTRNILETVEVTVLAVYTPLVTEYLGGRPAVEQHIRTAERQANMAFQNSSIPLQIRVVAMEEVTFPESHDFDTDLDRLALGSEGQHVRERRNELRADQVALVVDDGNMGGLAFGLHPRWEIADNPSPLRPDQFDYWSQRAFFEIRDDCIDESYKCFTHELAHNLGAGHDHEDWLRLYWDAHGYAFNPPNDNPNEGLVGTMLAYDGANHRKLYFSNPGISYAGKATGIVGRNNSRAITDSMEMVARYK